MVFVGDGKLGGIGVTLASLEALWSRGYRIDAVVFIEPGGANGDGGGVGEAAAFDLVGRTQKPCASTWRCIATSRAWTAIR